MLDGNVVTVDVTNPVIADAYDDEVEPTVADLRLEVDMGVGGDRLAEIHARNCRKDADKQRPLHRFGTEEFYRGRIDSKDCTVRVETQNRRRIEICEGGSFRHVFEHRVDCLAIGHFGVTPPEVGDFGIKLLAAHFAVHHSSSLPTISVTSLARL